MIRILIYFIFFYAGACAMWSTKKEQVKNDHLPVGGYINDINTPYYSNSVTKRILNKFNKLANGNAVLYGKTKVFLDRKINIKDSSTCTFTRNNVEYQCVGKALCGTQDCDIILVRGKSTEEYRQILLHEYMHCMGLNDNDDPNDLMYKSENMVSEENIQHYANEAATRQELWKNLLNLSSSIKQIK